MIKRLRGSPSAFALLLVLTSSLGASGWLAWSAVASPGTNFLPHRAPAEWIVYPSAPSAVTRPRLMLGTAFRAAFAVDAVPPKATLKIAGFHHYSLSINGAAVDWPLRRGRNWKQPDQFDVTAQLRTGANQIVVTVSNSTGPPALWLQLQAGGQTLVSGTNWTASCAGAAWRPARLASQRADPPAGGFLYSGEASCFESFCKCWPLLLAFTVMSVAAWVVLDWRGVALESATAAGSKRQEVFVFLGLALFWVALFANNVCALPELFGFDAVGHMEYIRLIMERADLPQPGDGVETFQPPLYYVVCAVLLKTCSLSLSQSGGIMLLRVFGMAVGIAHLGVIWASLRLLFPGESRTPVWGAALAAALPPMLYLSQYITNEALAALLMTACVFLCLRLMQSQRESWVSFAGLGFCLGLALLAKSTALLLAPLMLCALFWWWFERRATAFSAWAGRMCVAVATCSLVSGWQYARMFRQYGNSFKGVVDPTSGFLCWQDYGYLTGAFWFRFGYVLVHPWFSGLNSVGDGFYSTLWGDGLLGGSAFFPHRPPWNYSLMAVGYWLALIPVSATVVGGVLTVRKFVRRPTPEWFLVLGLAFLGPLALFHIGFVAPCWTIAKAFYVLGCLVPLCAFAACGFDSLCERGRGLRALICVLFGIWAINGIASFWICRSSRSCLLAQASSLRGQGRFSEAAPFLETRLRLESKDEEARALLADTWVRNGEWDKATEETEQILRDAPNNASAHVSFAAILMHQNRPADAVQQLVRAIELAPGNTDPYGQVAQTLLEHNEFEEAVLVAREGLAIDPDLPQLHLVLGTALANQRTDAEAISQLDLAGHFDTEWAAPRILLGAILARHGRLDEAATAYSAALRSDTNNPSLRVELGKVLASQGRFDDALVAVTKAHELALAAGQADLAATCQKLTELFNSRRPYRDP